MPSRLTATPPLVLPARYTLAVPPAVTSAPDSEPLRATVPVLCSRCHPAGGTQQAGVKNGLTA